VLSTGDDPEFFNQAKASVISSIISAQSVGVDTVSGATFSSNGIIGAVKSALSGALNTGNSEAISISIDTSALTPEPVLTPSPSPVPTPTPNATATPSNDGPIALADGDYYGTGTGFHGDIDVTVTVQNGYITKVRIDNYRDDEKYFSRAESKIIDRVIAAQSVEVDTVSGATYSSRGILSAILDALGENYKVLSADGVYDSVSGATSVVGKTSGSGSNGVTTVSGATSVVGKTSGSGSTGVASVSGATTIAGSSSGSGSGSGSGTSSSYEEEHEDDDD